MKPAIFALPALLALLAAGCGPLVQVGTPQRPPPVLLVTTAAPPASVPAGIQPVDMATAVTVQMPTLPGSLQTLRIPVTVTDTQVQYVRDATWAELPSKQFQRLLADTLVGHGVAVVDPRASGRVAGRVLTGQLLAFGVDTRAQPVVRVRYDATLAGPDGVRQRRFEREEPLANVLPVPVADALNRAANAVAADVAAWVGDGSGSG
jgi:cholesterol transport system auxiliary component